MARICANLPELARLASLTRDLCADLEEFDFDCHLRAALIVLRHHHVLLHTQSSGPGEEALTDDELRQQYGPCKTSR
jgi:hypothetical protein